MDDKKGHSNWSRAKLHKSPLHAIWQQESLFERHKASSLIDSCKNRSWLDRGYPTHAWITKPNLLQKSKDITNDNKRVGQYGRVDMGAYD